MSDAYQLQYGSRARLIGATSDKGSEKLHLYFQDAKCFHPGFDAFVLRTERSVLPLFPDSTRSPGTLTCKQHRLQNWNSKEYISDAILIWNVKFAQAAEKSHP